MDKFKSAMEHFSGEIPQFDVDPEQEKQTEKKASDLYSRIMKREFFVQTTDSVFINEKKLYSIYDELKNLIAEINKEPAGSLKIKINNSRLLLLSALDLDNWPASFEGEQKMIEEQKVKKFMQIMYLDEVSQIGIGGDYKYSSEISIILNKLDSLGIRAKDYGIDQKYFWLGEKTIRNIEEKLKPWQREVLFQKLEEISSLSLEGTKHFAEIGVNSTNLNGIQVKFLERAQKIALDFAVALHGEINNERLAKLLKDLEESKIEIMLLSSTLKVLKEKGVRVGIEDIRDTEVRIHEIGELAGEKKKEFRDRYEKQIMAMMEKSYEKTFAGNPAAMEKVRKAFRERFEKLEDYRVYMLTFRGEVVAFSVIKPMEGKKNEVMSESTVVHPDAQRYSWGAAFLKRKFERESQNNIIHGKVRADCMVIIELLEEIGFTTDRDNPFDEFGVEYYNVVIEKAGESRPNQEK